MKRTAILIQLTLILAIIGCKQDSSTDRVSKPPGTYSSSSNSENFVTLWLRSDSTYQLIWIPLKGDAMFEEKGEWHIDGRFLELIKGKDISRHIFVQGQIGVTEDTLTICIGKRLKEDFSIKLNRDSLDFVFPDSCISFSKNSYIVPELDGVFETYEYYRFKLEGRQNAFYFGIPNVFKYKYIILTLSDSIELKLDEKLEFMQLAIAGDGLIPLENEFFSDTLHFELLSSD